MAAMPPDFIFVQAGHNNMIVLVNKWLEIRRYRSLSNLPVTLESLIIGTGVETRMRSSRLILEILVISPV
jgi:hypothetical protein